MAAETSARVGGVGVAEAGHADGADDGRDGGARWARARLILLLASKQVAKPPDDSSETPPPPRPHCHPPKPGGFSAGGGGQAEGMAAKGVSQGASQGVRTEKVSHPPLGVCKPTSKEDHRLDSFIFPALSPQNKRWFLPATLGLLGEWPRSAIRDTQALAKVQTRPTNKRTGALFSGRGLGGAVGPQVPWRNARVSGWWQAPVGRVAGVADLLSETQ